MDAVAGREYGSLSSSETSVGPAPDSLGDLSDHATYTEVLAGSIELPPSPRFFFGAVPPDVITTYFSRSTLPSTGVYLARNLTISAGFVLSAQGRILLAPKLNLQRAHVNEAVQQFGSPLTKAPRRVQAPLALITGPGYKIYGHWLADMLPRLAVLSSLGIDLDQLRLLVADDIPSFAEQMLALLGFDESRLVRFGARSGPVQAEELLLPTFLHNGVRYSRILERAVSLLSERVESRQGSLAQADYPKRILIARTGKGQRVLIDREAMEKQCIDAGFTRVTPEALPLIEQWRMFRGAREIIGEYGSALHGSLFSSPGTVVCGIRGSTFHPAFIQTGFGEILQQPTGYVFGETVDQNTNLFRIRPQDIKACLSSAFGKAAIFAPGKLHEKPPSGWRQTLAQSIGPVSSAEVTIDFGKEGNSSKYCVSGWSAQEQSHTWTVGNVSVLSLPRLSADRDWRATLDVGAFVVPPAHSSQSLQIEVNGRIMGSFSLSKRETLSLKIPRELLTHADQLYIKFWHPDCFSPKSAGSGDDDRDLAFSFHHLTLSLLSGDDIKCGQSDLSAGK